MPSFLRMFLERIQRRKLSLNINRFILCVSNLKIFRCLRTTKTKFLGMKLLPLLQAAFLLSLFSCADKANEADKGDKVEFPTAHALNQSLGHGINLGNALDAPAEGDWGVTLKEEYFQWIADSGFATVRIPVRWSAHAMPESPYTIDAEFLKRVQWAVDLALEKDLNVIVNMHHYDSMMTDPAGQEERFLSMWKQIANAFKDYPPELVFEILNEPKNKLDAPKWNALLVKAIDVIREIHPERTLMVGTAPWGGIDGLNALELPDDSNLIVTVHYYEPHQFTHQGASFEAGADAWLGKTWRATPSQRASIDNALKQVADWSKEQNRPIYLGEFGTYFKVDSISRAFYTEYMVRKMDSLGISWALWNFSSDFGIYVDSTAEVHQYLVQALLHPGNNAALDSAMNTGVNVDLTKYVMMDDFEGHDDYKGLTKTGWEWLTAADVSPDSSLAGWYAFFSPKSRMSSPEGDSLLNIMDIIDQDLKPNFFKAIGPWGYTGNGIHIISQLKGTGYPYIGFGAAFTGWDTPEFYYDLCSITAVAFRAKGKGSWLMQLITDTVDNDYETGKDWGHFQSTISLTDNWQEYVISAEELAPKPWSPQETDGLVWKDGCMYTNAIEFQNGQSYGEAPDEELEIYIDDIRLIGLDSLKVNAPIWKE